MMELTLTVPMLKLFFALSKPKNRLKLKQAEPKELYQPLLNVKYGQDKQQVFDMYHAPKNVKQNILFIQIHGGYYVGGNYKDNYPFASFFLKKGIDVILVEYRHNDGKKN